MVQDEQDVLCLISSLALSCKIIGVVYSYDLARTNLMHVPLDKYLFLLLVFSQVKTSRHD